MEKENKGGNRLTQVHLEKWPFKTECVCVCYCQKFAINNFSDSWVTEMASSAQQSRSSNLQWFFFQRPLATTGLTWSNLWKNMLVKQKPQVVVNYQILFTT